MGHKGFSVWLPIFDLHISKWHFGRVRTFSIFVRSLVRTSKLFALFAPPLS